MSRHLDHQDRLAAIEAQLSLNPTRQGLPRRVRRHDAVDPVSPMLQGLLGEILPGAQVLDWRQNAGGQTGRMAADGLVYRWRVDGDGVGYRPAWDGVQQRGWEVRSDSFLELRAPAARMDFRMGTRAPTGQKRKCSTGYGCGSACISLQKECRISPSSAMGKARLRRLQQLAAGGDIAAKATASQVSAARDKAAGERQKERTTKRVEKLLARPEIAEYLRSGKLPQAASASTEPGTVRNMKPDEIVFDPGRFQYKLNATAGTGEVGSLSGVRKWDPNLAGVMSVWTDPADGRIYVVNGHNRLSLAKRLGAEEVTVRFLNAKNATEARAIGAMQNIAEGAGTPMDAAKFFRDTGIKSKADVEAKGLPLGSGQADKGLKLSKLPAEVFNAVVRGDLSVNRGAIIGGSGLDEAKQREVFTMVSARKGIADQTLLELVEHAASVQRTQTTFDLFGENQEAKDNLITRAKLAAGLKAKISKEKRLFGTVSKARAASTLAEKAGNVINQEQSAKVAGEASEALAVFERLKSSSGPISSALNRAADRVEAGESETKVRQELERDVFAAVEQELQAVGLRKRPRADSLQQRIDALKRKCQTGYGCGSACISLRKECRSNPSSAMGKERLKRLMELAAGGPSSQRGIGTVKAEEAGKLAEGITARRGEKAAQLRTLRQIGNDPDMTPRAQQRPTGGALVPTGQSAPAITPEVVNAEVLPARPAASRPGSIASTMRETLNAMKAVDARQMGKIAENLFEASWLVDRHKRFRGMTKDQAREQFKVEFMQKMQDESRSPEAAARRQAMGQRAAESGSVAGAMRSLIEDMKASDERLNDLQRQSIDLRIKAEEFGGDGEEPTLGGDRSRRRLGGSRRRDAAADSLEARIDALKRKCSTGYGCGSTCISLQKECRTKPGSAIGKERLKRLLALAGGAPSSQRGIGPLKAGDAGKLAEGITARRGEKAGQLRGARQQAAAEKAQAAQAAQAAAAGAQPKKPYTPTPQIYEPLSTEGLPPNWDDYDVAKERNNNKGGLKFWRSKDGRHPAYFYFFRDRAAAEHWLSDDNARAEADGDAGTANRRSKEWQGAYQESYINWRNIFNKETSDYDLLKSAEAQASSGKATSVGTVVDVRIAGNKHSRPVRENMHSPKPPQQGTERQRRRLLDSVQNKLNLRSNNKELDELSYGDLYDLSSKASDTLQKMRGKPGVLEELNKIKQEALLSSSNRRDSRMQRTPLAR